MAVSREVMIRGHGFKFFRACIVWMLQRYWLFTKILCYLLFSIGDVIGQFSSKWPGPSSRTVKEHSVVFLVEGEKFKSFEDFIFVVGSAANSVGTTLEFAAFRSGPAAKYSRVSAFCFFSVHNHGFCDGSNTFSQECSCR